MATAKWPEQSKRSVLGKRISRVDGIEKASGQAKYNSDRNLPGMLQAVILSSPHAHARLKSIDLTAAQASKGVAAVRLFQQPGAEIVYQHQPIAAVAASTEELARDAVRKIKIDYEILPHLVKEQDLTNAEAMKRTRPSGERVEGDPDDAFRKAEVTVEASYGIPVITHCCLEPHGQVSHHKGAEIDYYPSTQAVSDIAADLARNVDVPANQINVIMDHIGGGFGSKFVGDEWGVVGALISKDAGGKPVKMFLDRAQELTIAGTRPSFYAKIKIGGNKDGSITAWDSLTWATGGVGGGGAGQMPYVIQVPNRRSTHIAVSTNTGSARAWRAPNHPQNSFLTCAAIEDFAAKIGMDPLEVYKKNVQFTPRAEVYRYQLNRAAELIGWKQKYHARGDSGKGPIKSGLGIGIATWGGMGHNSTCKTTILPDGSVTLDMGTQDLGTGTRTCILQVASETLGVPMEQIKLNIGRNQFPKSGGSGGSTTIGGVSASTRKSTTSALNQLAEKVAGTLGVAADQIEAKGGKLQVIGNPSKSLTWKEACSKLGTGKIEAVESFATRNPEGLASQGVGGIQMADVSVDVETGVVRMNKMVAVHDIGLVVNPKLADSQVYGACIMSICAALMEESVRDQMTGRTLNADVEFYKLAGISDIGEIQVELDMRPEIDGRGVIGLGEPPAVPGVAAIANAVANAIGVRVPEVPLTPDRVLNALYGKMS
jgi:xanthine dehydrogenase YagR molybdenum-binding subunit